MRTKGPDGAGTAIFLHIHKTAGTTLNKIIERQYEPEEIWSLDEDHGFDDLVSMSEARRARIRLLRGHMEFGLHEFLPAEATYFTLLRQPVERVISFYHFICRLPTHYAYAPLVVEGQSLEEFLRKGQSKLMDNGQTRMLAGAQHNDYPVGGCTRELLEAAMKNLRRSFSVVGLVERFDETLLLLRKVYGWRDVRYIRHNVTYDRPMQDELSPGTLDLIAELNQLDLELYKYATLLLDEKVRAQGLLFARQVASFKAINGFLGRHFPLRPDGNRTNIRVAVGQWLWH